MNDLQAHVDPHPDQIPHIRVSELTQNLAGCIQHYFSDINVRGEIGSLKPWRNGHYFLTLKEGDASVDAVIWARDVAQVHFKPKVGDEVIVNGDLRAKPGSGQTSLHIHRMIPSGEGRMQLEFERICAEFKARGLLDRALPLPQIPRAVGLVTSGQSSAFHDFHKTHAERAPGIPIIFADAIVQGRESFASVSAALHRLYQDPRVDVIALTRGGGSMEHLWDFNHPELCYLISQSPKPIVVGIGHEDNTLLAELVADVRGHTPTKVAQAVFPHTRELTHRLNALTEQLERNLYRIGSHANQRLERLKAQLEHEAPHLKVERASQQLMRLRNTLSELDLLQPPRTQQQNLESQLDRSIEAMLQRSALRLQSAIQQLEVLSPLKTLARGYSLVKHGDGEVLSSTEQVSSGDQLTITLSDGEIITEVRSIQPKSNSPMKDDPL